MNNSILIIEDTKTDFQYFHNLINANFQFYVFPEFNANLSQLYGLQCTPSATLEERVTSFIDASSNYIINNQLYKKISAIILDIKILDDYEEDKTGLKLLEYIRYKLDTKLPEKYMRWGKVIPIIALTNYPESRYKDDFMKNSGSLLQFFYKDNVKINPEEFRLTLKNFDMQMTEVYSLFYEPELKSILNKVERNYHALNDLKELASLSLYSQIASMDVNKRFVLIDNFADKLIIYTKDINGFMNSIEDIEEKEKVKKRIISIFDTSSKALGFLSGILAFSEKHVKAEKVIDIVEKASSLMSDLVKV